MSRLIEQHLRRIKRDYRLKVALPAAVVLITAKTLQCLIRSKLLHRR